MVRPIAAAQLYQADQEAVHRLEHAHLEIFNIGLRPPIGLGFSPGGLEDRHREGNPRKKDR